MTAHVAAALPQPGDWSGFEGLRRVQEARLPDALRLAARSPFYRDRLTASGSIHTVEDLDAVAVMDKADLRDNYPFGLLAVDRAEIATYLESSGTSGRPNSSYFTDADWLDVVDRFNRNAVDLTADDTLLVRTPYAMLITAHQAHLAGRHRGATIVPADNRSSVVTHARVVRLLRDLDITVTWSLPTEISLWAAAARVAGLRPDSDFPALRGFVVGGEPLSPARRERISREWGGVPILQDYGSTETGSLAGECCQGRLHLWADRFVPQVLDPVTGHSALSGTGELVITTLYREAMPLVRYNLHDRVRIAEDDCSCGMSLPTIEVLGRDESSCVIGGRRVSEQQLEDAVYSVPGVSFWRARAGARLEIQIEAIDGEDPSAALVAAIETRTGVDATVHTVPRGTIVPAIAFTKAPEFGKPRTLFRVDEDWDRVYW